MKAFEINQFGIDNLTLSERKIPEAGPREVLVRFRAASLNYRDLMVVNGTYNPRMKLPAIPLSDGAGEIVSVGSEVENWKPGDRVMPTLVQRWFDGDLSKEKRSSSLGAGSQWDGVLREYGAFDERSVVRIPEHLSYEQAATLPCAALTAWNALEVSGRVKAGDTVVTLGTGGVSIFAVQLAKLAGAHIIATSSSEEKIGKLTLLGADETINYRKREDWDAAVLELTDKRGADHVIEVGGAGTLTRSLNAVRIGGHVAMIGALTGPGEFNPTSVFMKAVRLQGIFVGSREMILDLIEAVEVNKIEPVIDTVFDFEEVPDALRYMENGSHFGKIVIRI